MDKPRKGAGTHIPADFRAGHMVDRSERRVSISGAARAGALERFKSSTYSLVALVCSPQSA